MPKSITITRTGEAIVDGEYCDPACLNLRFSRTIVACDFWAHRLCYDINERLCLRCNECIAAEKGEQE